MKTKVTMATLTLALCLAAAEARAQRGIAQGKVVDEKGQAVVGATVSFEFQGGVELKFEAKTDKKGRYTQIVEPGRYRVSAKKDGYQGVFIQFTILGGPPIAIPELQLTSEETAIAAAVESDAVLGPLKKAMELTQAGKLDEAEAAYKQVLAKDPSVVEAHYNLGSIYLGRKDLAAAEVEFQRVVELEPQSGQGYARYRASTSRRGTLPARSR